MESLIYDRTLSDITNLTSKGKYNASDLNRVESWTRYLNDKFNELGYRTEDKPIINLFNTKSVSMTYSGLTIAMSQDTLTLTGNCTGNTGKRTIASELNIPKGNYIVKLIGVDTND